VLNAEPAVVALRGGRRRLAFPARAGYNANTRCEEHIMRPIEIYDRGRGPELKGTRITVYDVVYYHLKGRSPNYTAAVLGLATDEVQALLRYFEEHREEVLARHSATEDRNARGNPPEVEAKARQSHAKLLARRDELRRALTGGTNGDGHPG
jgi:uncharacterized protein (DUF433 family)